MQYRRRLRSRIVLSFLVFGTLLSALFAISTLLILEFVEDELIGETIAQELDDYLHQLRIDPSVVASHPNLEAILQVRIWDDEGKVPGMVTPAFAHYAPLLQRIVDAHTGATP